MFIGLTLLGGGICPVYSQLRTPLLPFANPIALNPASTGGGEEGFVIRSGGVYTPVILGSDFSASGGQIIQARNVWANMTAGIQSRYLTGGLGVNVESELIGGFAENRIQGLFAYQAPIRSRYTFLRMGLSLGVIQRTLSQNDFYVFEDQYRKRNLGFDPGLPSADGLRNAGALSVWAPDVSLGVLFYQSQKIKGNPELNPFAGISLQHINRPAIGFLNRSGVTAPLRAVFQLGLKQRFRKPFDLTMAVLVITQNESRSLHGQIAARYAFHKGGDLFDEQLLAISAGLSGGTRGNLAPYFICEIKNRLSLGFTLNFALAPADFLDNPYGGVQVSLKYVFSKENAKQNALPFPIF